VSCLHRIASHELAGAKSFVSTSPPARPPARAICAALCFADRLPARRVLCRLTDSNFSAIYGFFVLVLLFLSFKIRTISDAFRITVCAAAVLLCAVV
jgi:hypothetical protein